MAGAAAMAQQVEVKLELLAAGRDREHRVVKLLEGGAGTEQGQASAHAGDVGVDGHVAHPEREQQHARGGLAADSR